MGPGPRPTPNLPLITQSGLGDLEILPCGDSREGPAGSEQVDVLCLRKVETSLETLGTLLSIPNMPLLPRARF